MTRRSVWVVEVRRTGKRWRPNVSAYESKRDALAYVDWTRRYAAADLEMRVVEYTPKGGEEESDG